jgi:hypothetical protein
VRIRLLGRNETSANPNPCRSRSQNCGNAPSAADPTRPKDRYRDGVQHSSQQGQEAKLPSDVAARFVTLSDHEIAAGALRRHGLAYRTHLPGDQCTGGMNAIDQRGIRVTPEEIDHPRSWRYKIKDLEIVEIRDEQVHPKWL